MIPRLDRDDDKPLNQPISYDSKNQLLTGPILRSIQVYFNYTDGLPPGEWPGASSVGDIEDLAWSAHKKNGRVHTGL